MTLKSRFPTTERYDTLGKTLATAAQEEAIFLVRARPPGLFAGAGAALTKTVTLTLTQLLFIPFRFIVTPQTLLY